MNKILERQGSHMLGYVLLGLLQYGATLWFPEKLDVSIWGLSAFRWIVVAWVFAGLFQFWIAFVWRLELYRGTISAWLGDAGFTVHKVGYVVLGLGRFLPLIPISRATAQTSPIPSFVAFALVGVTAPPVVWALYSTVVYFPLSRAAGADHFDPAYRNQSLETGGIYQYVPHAMYVVLLLLLYYPGLMWGSTIGLMVAGAHHAFVWCHYWCTEQPDLRTIYGEQPG